MMNCKNFSVSLCVFALLLALTNAAPTSSSQSSLGSSSDISSPTLSFGNQDWVIAPMTLDDDQVVYNGKSFVFGGSEWNPASLSMTYYHDRSTALVSEMQQKLGANIDNGICTEAGVTNVNDEGISAAFTASYTFSKFGTTDMCTVQLVVAVYHDSNSYFWLFPTDGVASTYTASGPFFSIPCQEDQSSIISFGVSSTDRLKFTVSYGTN